MTPRAGISGWCVWYPTATALLTLASLLLGLLVLLRFGVTPLLEMNFPTIQINALLPGGSSETVALLVATPLEVQFSAISGTTETTSSNALGTTTLTLRFSLDRSIDVAAQEAQVAIDVATGRLPVDMPNLPTWRKANPTDSLIMTLRVNSEMMPLVELNDYAETILVRQLSQVNGAGQTFVVGQQRPATRTQAQPEKLAVYQLTLVDLRQSLQSANVNLIKGVFHGEGQVSILTADDQLSNTSDYDDLVVAYCQGAPVLLKDVARIVSAPEDGYAQVWPNGVPEAALVILRQPGANIVDTAGAIQAALPRLREMLPATIEIDVLNDHTWTTRSSLHEVELILLLAIGLAVLVMGLFLRQLLATLTVATVLAVSLSASSAAMYVFGFILNSLILVALIIAVGFIVDDIIVAVENIHRHLEVGTSKVEAALKGAAETDFTVISISSSLTTAFIPLLFMGGVVGRPFRELVVSVTVVILIPVVALLALTSMLASHFMPASWHAEAPREGFVEWLTGGYERGLRWAFGHQWLMLVSFAFTMLVAVTSYVGIPKGFFPSQDITFVFGTSQAAEDIPYDDTAVEHRQLAEIIAGDSAVQSYNHAVGVIGGSQSLANGHFWIVLKDRGERDVSVGKFIDRLRPQLAKVPGIMFYLRVAQDINLSSGPSRTQYQYALRNSDSTQLTLRAQRLTERLKQVPGLMDVSNDLQVSASVTALDIGRVATAYSGLSAKDVSQALYDALGQRQVGEYQTEINQHKVVLKLDARQRDRAESLDWFHLRSPLSGEMVPLSAIVKVAALRPGPLQINYNGMFPAVSLSFNLAVGMSLGEAVQVVQRAQEEIGMPLTIIGVFQGAAQAPQSPLASQPLLILIAPIVVHIILGVLYESFVHPLTILSTLPSAGIGAVSLLWAWGQDFSIMALTGIVLLIGIAEKNGILMVDFAIIAQHEQGTSVEQAIYQACPTRFRSIMMITLAALLGMIPLMISFGIGSELRQPLGIAVIGGLLASQVPTLFSTSAVYLVLERLPHRRGATTSDGGAVGATTARGVTDTASLDGDAWLGCRQACIPPGTRR